MKALVIAIGISLSTPAFAWDGAGMWYRAADDDNPGGGGILGTGGGHDHGIKCTDCHVNRKTEPALGFTLAFAPPITTTYVPGQRYQVTAQLSGAQLGSPCNMQYTQNVDNFAASFEDDTGAPAGALASDSGPTSSNCATQPQTTDPGTTTLDGDCAVIFARGAPNTDTWTFTWTAPASGDVRIFYGAVDGDCDMMSMGDAVVVSSRTLAPAPSAADLARAIGDGLALVILRALRVVLAPDLAALELRPARAGDAVIADAGQAGTARVAVAALLAHPRSVLLRDRRGLDRRTRGSRRAG